MHIHTTHLLRLPRLLSLLVSLQLQLSLPLSLSLYSEVWYLVSALLSLHTQTICFLQLEDSMTAGYFITLNHTPTTQDVRVSGWLKGILTTKKNYPSINVK